MRRATKNILSPKEKLEASLKAAKTFEKETQLGHVMLLPSKIEGRVMLRHKKSAYSSTLSTICVLPPEDRVIHLRGNDAENDILNISTPKLIYQYDIPINKVNNTVSSGNGHLFKVDSKAGMPLVEALKTVTQFFFPHVYFAGSKGGHMCITHGATYSPRALNTKFWSSNFTKNWRQTYGASWDLGTDGVLYPATTPSEFQKHQESVSPVIDGKNRRTLNTYSDYFELFEKPVGVFASTDAEVLEKVEEKIDGIVTGFAFLRDQDYWVWLKDGQFLQITPQQVKVL